MLTMRMAFDFLSDIRMQGIGSVSAFQDSLETAV